MKLIGSVVVYVACSTAHAAVIDRECSGTATVTHDAGSYAAPLVCEGRNDQHVEGAVGEDGRYIGDLNAYHETGFAEDDAGFSMHAWSDFSNWLGVQSSAPVSASTSIAALFADTFSVDGYYTFTLQGDGYTVSDNLLAGSTFADGVLTGTLRPDERYTLWSSITPAVTRVLTSDDNWAFGYASEVGMPFTLSATQVPEPSTLALLGTALVGFGLATRRRRYF